MAEILIDMDSILVSSPFMKTPYDGIAAVEAHRALLAAERANPAMSPYIASGIKDIGFINECIATDVDPSLATDVVIRQ